MADVVLPPSPNWYLSSIMCVSSDGTIIYGSSIDDISILTPAMNADNRQRFKLDIIHNAHKKRITCLALCPNWSITNSFVSGSEDGIVKLWNRVSASFSIAHNIHLEAKEEVVGATFLNEKEIVSIGNTGVIVLWNIAQNTVKVDYKVLKLYKPLCISPCPLKQNTVAIGTKQGVVLVLSVTDKFMMLFKAHGHETEVTSVCWCPTSYCDPLEKIVSMKRHKIKTFRVRKISNRKSDNVIKSGPNADSGLYQQSSGEEADESDIFDVNKETGLDDECFEQSDSDCGKDKRSGTEEVKGDSCKQDDNLVNAMEKVQLSEKSTDLEKNESFISDCKKLLDFMNSKKALKSNNVSFILDPDDSTLNESKTNPADESDIFNVYEEPPFYEFGHSKYVPYQAGDDKDKETPRKSRLKHNFLDECKKLENVLKGEEEISFRCDESIVQENHNESHNVTQLNENQSTLEKSDIFDIYEEPPFYEFGHSKYIPEPIDKKDDEKVVANNSSSDFLEECSALKQKIIQSKSDDKSSENESISMLSGEVNKLRVTNSDDSPTKVEESSETQAESRDGNYFFLASACKNGKVCIWKWGGNLVLSGVVSTSKEDKYKKLGLPWSVLLWPSSKLLLVASRGAQLLRCNFNSIHLRSKGFGFSTIHDEHLRGLYCVAANMSTEVDTAWRNRPSAPLIWSVGQDRLLIGYSSDDSKVVTKINTCGGHITCIAPSPIDPNRYAISAGDGVVRVWDFPSKSTENNGMGQMKVFWQNVQGKVQACSWHPTKENMIAFGNAEGRIGLIDVTTQNAAKLLPSSLPLGVNGLSWGLDDKSLYVHGTGKLMMYDISQINQDPIEIIVTILDRKWDITAIAWSDDYFTVGSKEGGVALLKPGYPHSNVTYVYPHRKLVTCICWHPLAVSTDHGISPYANLVAVSSNNPVIVILKVVSGDDGIKLEVHDEISQHSTKVNKLCWSPHHNGRLLSVSADHLAQVYDVINKCPLHTLVGHVMGVLCCVWSPIESNLVMTAGEDFSLRVWNLDEHPYKDIKVVSSHQKKKMKLASLEMKSDKLATQISEKENKKMKGGNVHNKSVNQMHSDSVLAHVATTKKTSTIISQSALSHYWKQIKVAGTSVEGCKRLLNYYISKFVDKNEDAKVDYSCGFDYLRIYGSYSDVCELLDLEKSKQEETLSWSSWAAVGLLRGDVKNVLEKAKELKVLSSLLLCLAPYVSNRFWKEMMSSYMNQFEGVKSGNIMAIQAQMFRCASMLASGSVEEACNTLISEGLIEDAMVASKIRHADKISQECFQKLLENYKNQWKLNKVAECYIASGNLMDAAVFLGKSNDEEYLSLAAIIAKHAGNCIFAESIATANKI